MPISAYTGPSVFGYETDQPVRRAAMISLHTSPIARIGQRDAGGMNIYVRSLALQLARQGLEIDIFTRRSDPHTPEVVTVSPGVNVIHITAGPAEALSKNDLLPYIHDFASEAALYSLRAQVRYDIIHAHYWLSGLAAEQLKRYWHIPSLLMFHTTAHMKNAVAATADRETAVRLETERRLVHEADGLIAGNPDEQADLAAMLGTSTPNAICMIPPGVDLARFFPGDRAAERVTLGLDPDAQLVLSVGRVDPIKGFDTLLAAFRDLARRNASAHLLLAGGAIDEAGNPVGPMTTYAHIAEDLGIRNRVRFIGSIPHEDLVHWYRAVDVVAVPSRYESFGLVAIEAMASGAAVVASRVGGLRFSIENDVSGILVPHSQPAVLADAIDRVLRDDRLRERLSQNAVMAAQRYSWETVGAEIERMYIRLVTGMHRSPCLYSERSSISA
ncbi:MAG: glycosyltransferase [Thermomicrobiales bacterium]